MSSPAGFTRDALQRKVALITGGGTGINYGVARALGLHGCKIVITGRRKEVLDNAADNLGKEGITAFGVQGDVRKYEHCERAVAAALDKYGKIDILVNGAAGNFLSAAEDLTINGFKTVVEIDTFGTFFMCKAAFEALKATKGTIINISANLHNPATKFQVHAAAAKAGVDVITRTLALEWGKYGIRSVGIAPGPIGGTEGVSRLSGGGERLNQLKTFIPLGRMGHVDDVGQAAVFLSSSAASFITGQIILVDGGASLARIPFVPEETYKMMVEARKSKL